LAAASVRKVMLAMLAGMASERPATATEEPARAAVAAAAAMLERVGILRVERRKEE
jgi:hypothetical protein